MKTIAYVDGFNLYFRLLKKNRSIRWLDLEAMIVSTLFSDAQLLKINYYTARTQSHIDPDAPRKQQRYLNALKANPKIETHFGSFLSNERWAGLVHPPQFLPNAVLPPPYPDTVLVRKTEEKGSDVNLAAHLVRDAFKGEFEQAVVITNDTDLCEPIRIVVEEVGLRVGLLAPVDRAAHKLKNVASWVKHLKESDAAGNQLPDAVPFGRKGKITYRPDEWK